MPSNPDLDISYLPAIGVNPDGKPDYYWSDDPRPLGTIDTIIIHSMHNPNFEGEDRFIAEACRDLLNSYGVSAHYFIDRLGKIFQSVDECRQAWHAGKSKMPEQDNREGANKFSVGIELIADEVSGFTVEQYHSLVGLIAQIMMRLPIENILGHNDIATAAVRTEPKTDPWNFDWELFLTLLETVIGEEKYNALKLVGSNNKAA